MKTAAYWPQQRQAPNSLLCILSLQTLSPQKGVVSWTKVIWMWEVCFCNFRILGRAPRFPWNGAMRREEETKYMGYFHSAQLMWKKSFHSLSSPMGRGGYYSSVWCKCVSSLIHKPNLTAWGKLFKRQYHLKSLKFPAWRSFFWKPHKRQQSEQKECRHM